MENEMCSLHEEFGGVWPNRATKGSKSGQDWQLRFLRMAFTPAITIMWMVNVVWFLPAVKLHTVQFKLEWVTAEMECAVGGSTEGIFWSNDGKTIMFLENMCYLLSYREWIMGLTIYSGRICQILLG
jgi:hypothetical protein